MHAFEIPGLRFSLPAGGAIQRATFVSVNSDSQGVTATASTKVIGVAMNQCDKADEVLEIADGIVIVIAGAAITAGTAIASDASGKAVTASGDSCGIALTGATKAGEHVTVKLL